MNSRHLSRDSYYFKVGMYYVLCTCTTMYYKTGAGMEWKRERELFIFINLGWEMRTTGMKMRAGDGKAEAGDSPQPQPR